MRKWNKRENPISPIHLSSLLSYFKSPKPPAVIERLGLDTNPHIPVFFQYELIAVMYQALCCARCRQWWKRPTRTCPRELQSREGGGNISPTCHTPLGLISYPLSPALLQLPTAAPQQLLNMFLTFRLLCSCCVGCQRDHWALTQV